MVDDALVPVVTAEVGVAVGGLDLDDALADLQQGHVEGAATEVEDEDRLVVLLVQAVGQGSGGRLVDDPQDLQAGDLARLLRRGALGVVEVRRDRDHGVGHVLTEVGLGVPLQLLEHSRRDLLRRVLLPVDAAAFREPPVALPDVPLDRPRGAVDVGDRLPLGDLSDEDLSALAESHHGRGRPVSLGVRDDRGLAALQNRDHRVGRTQVNPHCARHHLLLSDEWEPFGLLAAAATATRRCPAPAA